MNGPREKLGKEVEAPAEDLGLYSKNEGNNLSSSCRNMNASRLPSQALWEVSSFPKRTKSPKSG